MMHPLFDLESLLAKVKSMACTRLKVSFFVTRISSTGFDISNLFLGIGGSRVWFEFGSANFWAL
jgi:hypothetical protein